MVNLKDEVFDTSGNECKISSSKFNCSFTSFKDLNQLDPFPFKKYRKMLFGLEKNQKISHSLSCGPLQKENLRFNQINCFQNNLSRLLLIKKQKSTFFKNHESLTNKFNKNLFFFRKTNFLDSDGALKLLDYILFSNDYPFHVS